MLKDAFSEFNEVQMRDRVVVLNIVSACLLLTSIRPVAAERIADSANNLLAQAPQQQAPQQPPNPFKDKAAPPAPGFPGKGDIKAWTRATVLFNQAIDLSSSRKFKEAVAKYQEAIKIYPYDPTFYANMAFSLERSGDPAAGVEASKKAIALQKDHYGAYENMGNCLYDLGKYSESRDAFNKALGCEMPMSKHDELIQVVNKLTTIIKA